MLHALGLMRQSLRATLMETKGIRELALEEVLVELERTSRICASALKDTVKAERFLKRSIT